jgi:hypothetical protein
MVPSRVFDAVITSITAGNAEALGAPGVSGAD